MKKQKEYVVIYYELNSQGMSYRKNGYVYAENNTQAWEKAEEKFGKENVHFVTQI